MNLSMNQRQTHRHREWTCDCQRGESWGRTALGFWGQQVHMQTTLYGIDKEQGSTVQHRELYSIPVINHNEKEY